VRKLTVFLNGNLKNFLFFLKIFLESIKQNRKLN